MKTDRVGQVWSNSFTGAICLVVRSEHRATSNDTRHQIVLFDGETASNCWYEDGGTSLWEQNDAMKRIL